MVTSPSDTCRVMVISFCTAGRTTTSYPGVRVRLYESPSTVELLSMSVVNTAEYVSGSPSGSLPVAPSINSPPSATVTGKLKMWVICGGRFTLTTVKVTVLVSDFTSGTEAVNTMG